LERAARKVKRRLYGFASIGQDATASNPKGKQNIGRGQGGFHAELAGYFLQNGWQNFPTQPPVCGRNDGLPAKLDGITFPKWRNESIKGYGNAVVPQVAFQIFEAIKAFDNT
jgi:DNA (cytosine-5)-methyltransferase 1